MSASPGPWSEKSRDTDEIKDVNGETVAFVARSSASDPDANKALIAAAPELKEACEAALYLLVERLSLEEFGAKEVALLRNALKKANPQV